MNNTRLRSVTLIDRKELLQQYRKEPISLVERHMIKNKKIYEEASILIIVDDFTAEYKCLKNNYSLNY